VRRGRLEAAGLRQRHAAGASTRPRVPLFAASRRRLCAVSARRRRPDDLRPCAAAAAPPAAAHAASEAVAPAAAVAAAAGRTRTNEPAQPAPPGRSPVRRRGGLFAPAASRCLTAPGAPPPPTPLTRQGGGRPPRARLAAPTDHCAFASLFSAPPSGWPKLPHPLPGAPASQPRSLGLAAPLHRRDPARATRAAETCTDAPAAPAAELPRCRSAELPRCRAGGGRSAARARPFGRRQTFIVCLSSDAARRLDGRRCVK